MPINAPQSPHLNPSSKSNVSFIDKVNHWLALKSKITQKDRMFFLEQLALLVETGTSLHNALEIIRQQTKHPHLVKVIDSVSYDISDGRPFSHALSRFPEIFPLTYINLIKSSEQGGFMHQVLVEILEMERKQAKLKNTLVSSMTYPIFIIVLSVAVVIFILTAIFPKFAEMFAPIASQLPMSTKVLMAISDMLSHHYRTIGAIMVAMLYCGQLWSLSVQGRRVIAYFKINLFILKNIFIQLYIVYTMRVLSLSLKNGVSVMDALISCRELVDNEFYKDFILTIESNVQEGKGLAFGFEQSKMMPELVKQMIATGENSGALPTVANRIADYYEARLTSLLETLSKIIEPLMLLIMGVVVGVIISSLILPIFKLSKGFH